MTAALEGFTKVALLQKKPVWERIVRTYEAKGLTEEDALVQARCAFILRHGHYEDDRVIHWTPPAPELAGSDDLWTPEGDH